VKTPTLIVGLPQADDIPDFGRDEYVYDRSVMLKTWLVMKGKTEISLPEETTALIEAVYGDELNIGNKTLEMEIGKAIEKAAKEERDAIYKAVNQLIGLPSDKNLMSERNNNLDEDDPTLNRAFRAMTRDTEPSVSLICLHKVGENLYLDPQDVSVPVSFVVKPDRELTRKLLRCSINVQNAAVVRHFSEHEPEVKWKGWQDVAALKYTIPIVFENGACTLNGTGYTLILDRRLGLTIQKENL
jgi:hypothetical protein